jgi:peptide deformylase
MPKLLQIAQLGHPILRQKARPVDPDYIMSRETQDLIDDMITTCMDVDGVGISAPQVYEPLRLFIMASQPSLRYPDAPTLQPTAMINPVIEETSQETEIGWEGCLSIPGIRGQVSRHSRIVVTYTDREGENDTTSFEGFLARIFQHEYDHLNGVVFLDITNSAHLVTEKEYQKIVAAAAKK